jgi:predicted secreted protein
VAAGETFEVPLEGTPTAGYAWEFIPEESGELVELIDSKFVLRPGGPGRSAEQVFRFRATTPGEATLHFRYGRPWENKAAQERSIPLTVSSPKS